ncbi:MAG: hypothetical protein ACON4J_04100 [Parvibaculales bacterium]
MLKKLMQKFVRRFLIFLDRFSPATKHKIMSFIRGAVATILPDRLYFELERQARLSLRRGRQSGVGIYTSQPKRKKTSYRILTRPKNKISKADIAVCCAFLGREKQLDLAIAESQFSKKSIVWFLMGSDAEDEAILERLSATYENVYGAVCDNFPVGAKWQSCVDFVNHLDFDYELLCITGSDDVIAAKGFDHVHDRYRHNLEFQKYSGLNTAPALFCTNGWYIYNKCQGSSYYHSLYKCHYNIEFMRQPLGAGRFYTRSYLKEIEGFLFDCSLNKNLDNWGYENLLMNGKEIALFSNLDVPVMSIKKKLEMNDFESILNSRNIAVSEIVFEGRKAFFSNFKVDVKGFEL